MEKLIDALLNAMDENEFMVNHEKGKVKELNKAIKQINKVNEKIENKVDVEKYIEDRDNHVNQLREHVQQKRKLNRVFKILIKDEEE